MKKYLSISIFVLVEIIVATFILATTGSLPENIASHFSGAGVPNGFMSQHGYLVFMLVFALGIPVIVVSGITAALRTAQNSINIPHKDFWLAPERKQQTIEFLNGHILGLGVLIALFVAYIHWLILTANSVQPAQLSNESLFVGMGVFMVSITVWGALLPLRFLRVPSAGPGQAG